MSGDEFFDKNAQRIFVEGEIMRFKDKLKEAMGNDSSRVFAAKCGLSDGVIRNYLSGKTYPSLDRLALIASASGRSIEWFIVADDSQHNEHKNTQQDTQSNPAVHEELKHKLLAIIELLHDNEIAYAIELFRRKGFEALMPEVINNSTPSRVSQRSTSAQRTSSAFSKSNPLTHKKTG